jgi:alkylation response protein AidB-like acyl-CoA dehydrogenase
VASRLLVLRLAGRLRQPDPVTSTSATEAPPPVAERLEQLLAAAADASRDLPTFRGIQFDLGLAWVHFPVGSGGLGIDPELQQLVDARLAEHGISDGYLDNPLGIGMVAPTMVTHGTDAQRARYLRPIFTAAEIWCQLFSEPGAGSDVASASTRAERDGESWIVHGQKVWTSLGHVADLGLLLARTDPDVPKHKGMTAFLVDMHAPGVDVRPLRQLTGDTEFNEVYFDGLHVDDDMRLGAIGEGWRVALTTLMNERVAIAGQTPPRGSGPIADTIREWHANPQRQSTARRDRLVQLWIEAEVIRLTNIRAQAAREIGDPGPEGSISKLAQTQFNQRCSSLAVDLLGPNGMLFESGYAPRPVEESLKGVSDSTRSFLRARANTIEGGTSEIMRNILGERILGLPGDVRVDRDVAWRDVARS